MKKYDHLTKEELIKIIKETEDKQLFSLKILNYLNQPNNNQEIIEDILKLITKFVNIEASAIRLKQGENLYFYTYNGFSEDFIKSKICPYGHNQQGDPIININFSQVCPGRNVLSGNIDPSLPFFTEGGSFWTNSTTKLMEQMSEKGHQLWTRDCCLNDGYESFAIIPLKAGKEIIGLLQFYDRRPDCFTIENIKFFEEISESIGIALKRKEKDEDFRINQEKLLLAQKATGAGIWDWNIVTGDMEWSLELFNLWGRNPSECKPSFDTWRSIVHPSDLKQAEEDIELAISNKTLFNSLYRIIKPDREERWIHAIGTTIYDETEKPVRMIGFCIDITDRKMTEKTLLESEKQYNFLFENMLNGVAYCKMIFKEGRPYDVVYISVNKAFEALTGLKNVSGKKISEIIPEIRDRDYEILEIYGRVSLTGKPEHVEKYVNTLDIWLSLSVYSPKSEHFITIFDVITERKKTEEALRISEERLKDAQKIAHIGNFIHNFSTDTIWCSDEMYHLFGFKPVGRKLSFQDIEDMIHPQDVGSWRLLKDRIINAGGALEAENRIILSDGTIRYHQLLVRINMSPEGHPVELIGTVQDITERKQAEEEQSKFHYQLSHMQKMKSIGLLAGGFAHNFNNILGSILGYTELALIDIGENNIVSGYLNKVITSCCNARDLIKQILILSQKSVNDKKALMLKTIIREAINLVRASMPSNIEIVDYIDDNYSMVMVDDLQIHQIIIDLCVNASHAIRDNSGIIDISLSDIDITPKDIDLFSNLKEGPYVKLIVRDNGPGMNSETLRQIFDPFFTTKDIGEGYGLGLPVVKGIMGQHNGDIKVYSEPGKGTAIHMFFPKMSDEKDLLPVVNEEKQRILLVDDEKTMLKLLQKIMRRVGYNVFATTSSLEAMEVFRNEPDKFDLIITDHAMPKMTGKELAKECLLIRPDIPVILCTGFSEYIDSQEAFNMGIKEFMKKPFNMAKIISTIQNVLSGK